VTEEVGDAAELDKAIAEHVAGLVPDGATLQVGIGSLPAVVLRHLRGHRDLGVHSGMITDEIAELIEAGVITGTRKSTDRGGIPVLALPSTAGTASRIVARLNGPAGLARADAGVIVTEYGVADLRGLSLARRRERMIAIAHPDHRAALDRTEDKT